MSLTTKAGSALVGRELVHPNGCLKRPALLPGRPERRRLPGGAKQGADDLREFFSELLASWDAFRGRTGTPGLYDSRMSDESPRGRIERLIARIAGWRPRSVRQIWLIVLVAVIIAAAEAIVIPAKRVALPCAVAIFVIVGLAATGSHRQRLGDRRAAELIAASVSRDGVPAEVIGLAAAGRKIRRLSVTAQRPARPSRKPRPSSTASDPTFGSPR
jgi:hypothetical protein